MKTLYTTNEGTKKKPVVYTALLTPFLENGEIDFNAFDRLLDFQIQNNIDGWVVCGSTGEVSTLSREEKLKLIEYCIKKRGSKPITIIAGTGTNCTKESVELSLMAAKAGVDSVLCVTPYYNKPNQAGMKQHFLQIADTLLPYNCSLTLYNNPGRSVAGLAAQTIAELSLHPKILSLKESSGRIEMYSEIEEALKVQCSTIKLFCGDDSSFLPALALGASGIISVASNLRPSFLKNLCHLVFEKDWEAALNVHNENFSFMKSLFIETNPVPAKFLLSKNSFVHCTENVRLPLTPLSLSQKELLKAYV